MRSIQLMHKEQISVLARICVLQTCTYHCPDLHAG